MVPIKYGKQNAGVMHCAKHDQCHPVDESCPWCDSRENDDVLKRYLAELDELAEQYCGTMWP